MHNLYSVLQNQAHMIFCDFEIQTEHLLPTRNLDIVFDKKNKQTENTCHQDDFVFLVDHRFKTKESEMVDKNLDL